jgi:SAM-dependent methyltransferase
MKIGVILENVSQASAFRFVAPAADWDYGVIAAEAKLKTAHESRLETFISFALQKQFFPCMAQLHVCAKFCLVLVRSQIPESLRESLKGMELYRFAEERGLNSETTDSIREIDWLHQFYEPARRTKVLITTNEQLVKSILANAPDSFVHFSFNEEDFSMCMGAELFSYDGASLRNALLMSRLVAQGISDTGRIALIVAQGSLAPESNSSYGFFADRYDRYMEHVDYDRWYNLLSTWHMRYGNKGRRVLELACGTAQVSSRFVAAGYDAYACDISAEMLENADKRLQKPKLYQAALTDPIPIVNPDLIICVFDSINYLTRAADLISCFREVAKALAPGGIFIFDISTMLNSMENFSDDCNIHRGSGEMMVHEAYYEPGKRNQVSRLELFLENGVSYVHKSEKHQQRVYMASEIADIIRESGLKLIAVHSTDNKVNYYPGKMRGLDHRHYRLFFVVKAD